MVTKIMDKTSKFWEKRKIYPSIITAGFDWESQIEEINSLGLKEVCLFATGADVNERKLIFKKLKESCVEKIPFVHIRHDTKKNELEFLVREFGSEKFNIHPQRGRYRLKKDLLSSFGDKIYIENSVDFLFGGLLHDDDVEGFAGFCVDVTHLADEKYINKDMFENTMRILEKNKNKVGCNHISPHNPEGLDELVKNPKPFGDFHRMTSLKQLDYLKNYPSWIFSDTIALEMQNSIKEQLEARLYIIDLLADRQ